MTPDCQTCGACCVGSAPPYSWDVQAWADLSDAEAEALVASGRLSARQIAWVTPEHVWSVPTQGIRTKLTVPALGPLAGLVVHTCVCLRGSVGHRTSCAIYSDRPTTCRQFTPGTDYCTRK